MRIKHTLFFWFWTLVISFSLFDSVVAGTIRYSLGRPVITLIINGHKKEVLFDTAADDLFLEKSFLEKNGKNIPDTLSFINLEGKVFRLPMWVLETISFDAQEIKKIRAASYTDWGVSVGDPKNEENIDGVIGIDPFKGKKIVFDFGANTFECVNHFPKSTEKTWVAFQGNLGFEIKVDGATLSVVIDTGSSFSVINEKNKVL